MFRWVRVRVAALSEGAVIRLSFEVRWFRWVLVRRGSGVVSKGIGVICSVVAIGIPVVRSSVVRDIGITSGGVSDSFRRAEWVKCLCARLCCPYDVILLFFVTYRRLVSGE